MVDSAQTDTGPDTKRASNFGLGFAQGHLLQAIEQIGNWLKDRNRVMTHLRSEKWRTSRVPRRSVAASGWAKHG